MGFIDYARSHSLEKDVLKLKIIIDPILKYPQLEQSIEGYSVTLPTPVLGEETLSYLGYTFPVDNNTMLEVTRLFKASVYHLTAHAVVSNFHDFRKWKTGKNQHLAQFIPALVEDLKVNVHIAKWYPDKVSELAHTSALSLGRMRDIEGVALTSTRLLTSLLLYANTGLKVYSKKDLDTVPVLYSMIENYKSVIMDSWIDEDLDISSEKVSLANKLYSVLIQNGPIIETPSLPFTENLGESSMFPDIQIYDLPNMDDLIASITENLGGSPAVEDQDSLRKVAESEALQVFESHIIEK